MSLVGCIQDCTRGNGEEASPTPKIGGALTEWDVLVSLGTHAQPRVSVFKYSTWVKSLAGSDSAKFLGKKENL